MTEPRLAKEYPSRWVRLLNRLVSIRGASWAVFCLALLVTAVVCSEEWRRRQISQRVRFEADTAVFRNAMRERLRGYACILQGGSGLFAASVAVEPDEFRAYVAGLELPRYNPGILAFGYAEWVAHSQRDEFLRKPTLASGQADQPFQIWPAGDRPDYLVVRYVEPFDDSNRVALGFDLGSDPVSRAAAMAARDSGQVTLTAKLGLAHARNGPGFLLMQPIYHPGTQPTDPDERRQHLHGWVYLACRTSDLMDGTRQISPNTLGFEVFDGTAAVAENLLVRNRAQNSPHARIELSETSVLPPVYGREWTIKLYSAGDSAFGNPYLTVELMAGGGVCISLLLFGIVHSMANSGRRAIALATDMTADLRRQEEALRASEKRLEMVIAGSNDGVWDWDVATNKIYFSPRWKSMLGYQDDELDNSLAAWEALLHPDDRDRSHAVLKSYFKGSLPFYQLEHRLRHKDGSYRWILARGVASRDPAGKPIRMAGSHVDLTELKQAEQDLRLANTELIRSQAQLRSTLTELRASHEALEKTQLELIQAAKLESIGTLAAGVAHEVKNPLQIIVMGLDFLRQRLADADETTRVTLTDMRDAALRADAITRELLHFSTETEFAPELADLEAVLERSLWLTRTDLTKYHTTVIKKLAGLLPPVAIDSPKIQQVLINLILNAIQAMETGGTLSIATSSGRLGQFLPQSLTANSPLRPDDQVVILRLQDSGPGIPDQHLPRIFDPFFTTKAVGAGAGLGLSVVKKIIDLHGALIAVRNASSGGLEVTLAFAAAGRREDDPVAPAA